MPPNSNVWSTTTPARNSVAHQTLVELLHINEQALALDQPLLTGAGVSYVRQKLQVSKRTPAIRGSGRPNPARRFQTQLLPEWDPESRRLWLGKRLLKWFRQPAPNQTMLLEVFQEQGWAVAHIDDPLPRGPCECEEDAKRRLHETLKNLNRNLPAGTIRFHGDGTGQGVVWEYD